MQATVTRGEKWKVGEAQRRNSQLRLGQSIREGFSGKSVICAAMTKMSRNSKINRSLVREKHILGEREESSLSGSLPHMPGQQSVMLLRL